MRKKIICVVAAVITLCGVGAGSSIITRNLTKQDKIIIEADDPDYVLIHEMINEPEKYFGKTITLKGYYSNAAVDVTDETSSEPESSEKSSASVEIEDTNSESSSAKTYKKLYHFITVFDKYKDCYQTIEIDMQDTSIPDVGAYITVTGTYHKFIDSNGQHLSISTEKINLI